MQWDFWSLNPESMHQNTILFSDHGLPASYHHTNGYGSHPFSFAYVKLFGELKLSEDGVQDRFNDQF